MPEWAVALNRGLTAASLLDCTKTSTPAAAAAAAQETTPKSSTPQQGCRVCGGAAAVAAACTAHPRCSAFVMDDSQPGCGQLMKGPGAGGQSVGVSSSQTLYCNTARGAKCTGEYRVCVGGQGGLVKFEEVALWKLH